MSNRVRDSRRLPGVSLLADVPGAVLDVASGDAEAPPLIAAWEHHARAMLDALGWGGERTRVRRFPGGASLFLSAPIDALYTATEINEWAWDAAERGTDGGDTPDLAAGADVLRRAIVREANPALLALRDAAKQHRVTFCADHMATSVGSGAGSRTFATNEPLPTPHSLDWTTIRDVPIVLITGSNGKTTTARLLAAVARAWGRTPGLCTTDNIVVGTETVDTGDWSGPMGARAVLRDTRVEVAILETARGGILRRGLALGQADAAIVTNIAEDHFGEWGITTLAGIADTKLVVGKVAKRLVLNADDPVLAVRAMMVKASGGLRAPIQWTALDPANDMLRAHLAGGGDGAYLAQDQLVLERRGHPEIVAAIGEVPITLGGAARFNVSNALGVIGLASALGVPVDRIARGLAAFRGSPAENPGRGHLFEVGGARVIVDFAHNPHGMRALIETAQALPARRRLVILGQAGDRDDASIRGLARETWPWRPDRVILKEMERYLRGRQPGDATGLIKDEFLKLGADPAIFRHATSEFEAVEAALAEAEPGDLVLLPVHAERERVLALLEARSSA